MAFKIIDLQDLERKLARKKTWIYDKIEKGLFPAPVKLAGSDKATGWIESRG